MQSIKGVIFQEGFLPQTTPYEYFPLTLLAGISLMWRHNGQSSVSNHQPYDCYTTVYSDADQSKHQSSASLAFVWGIHRDRWIPRTKGQLRGKCFHLMTSSCLDNMLIILVCRSVPSDALSLLCVRTHWRPGPRLNIKTVLSTYGDFHVKDKTAVRTSYL